MNIAIIPARGGSKRIPRKNIKKFFGRPIIAWSIQTAKQSNCFSKIIVSTEDSEIAEIANQYDAETPFIRPQSLADDYANTLDVMRHAVEWAEREYGETLKNVCCIYPTAPLIKSTDITNSLQVLQDESCAFVFSAKEYISPIQRSFRVNSKNRVEMFTPSQFYARSQDLERAYHDAGQFYWGKKIAWLTEKNIFVADSVPYILDKYRAVDIDSPEDWLFAEVIFGQTKAAE